MNSPRRPLSALLLCGLLLLIPNVPARAGSATWNLNPTNGDWNTAANWTPPTVPNGPGDIATFATSNQAAISLSADTEVNEIVFAPGAAAFTITASALADLTFSGAGVTNNSGITRKLRYHGRSGKRQSWGYHFLRSVERRQRDSLYKS